MPNKPAPTPTTIGKAMISTEPNFLSMTNKSKTATEAVIIILMMSPVPAPIKPFTSELNLITPEPANAAPPAIIIFCGVKPN
ncbi:Uncharacterised protein [Acinetobacter baumannii]|nr:Uncharacterised protein [Acinetobacter baumannii]